MIDNSDISILQSYVLRWLQAAEGEVVGLPNL